MKRILTFLLSSHEKRNEKGKLNEAFISFDINATGAILKKLTHFQGAWR